MELYFTTTESHKSVSKVIRANKRRLKTIKISYVARKLKI